MPTGGFSDNDGHRNVLPILVKHYQIATLIQTRLSASKLASKSLKELLPIVRDLDSQLRGWYDSLPEYFKGHPPYHSTSPPPGVQYYHLGFMTSLYNNSLISLHMAFCYPWQPLGSGSMRDSDVIYQRQASRDIVASASREIIAATQCLHLSPSCGNW